MRVCVCECVFNICVKKQMVIKRIDHIGSLNLEFSQQWMMDDCMTNA